MDGGVNGQTGGETLEVSRGLLGSTGLCSFVKLL